MDKKNDMKKQRDRFVAFSFASADLFIEVSPAGKVSYALGAAKSFTGIDHTKLEGRNWLELFAIEDHASLISLQKRSKIAQRKGPIKVTMDDSIGDGRDAIVTGIRMPEDESYYLAIGFVSEIMLKLAEVIQDEESLALLDKDTFLQTAKEALSTARADGNNVEITLLDIPNADSIKEKLGDEVWGKFTESITELLNRNSIDGAGAACISDGRYSVLHDQETDSQTLREQLSELAKMNDPEGHGFEVDGVSVTSDLESLSERETAKALVYTINEFERKGTSLNIETLNSGFKAYVSANAKKIHQFKSMISQLDFDLHFQPIVDMDMNTLSHYEILSRFRQGGSTQEWVIFGEDIGMAADFDIAVTERVINYLLYKAGENRHKFAMNLSGQSIQNEQFFKTLMAKLLLHKDLADRIIFEITESNTIEELEMVNSFINNLQQNGYKVCLDDFGAGASSLKYLQTFDVDFIKIDGQYTRKILSSRRDQVLIKNLTQMCFDLNINVIAEQIEQEAQMNKMKELGVPFGQGHYFGYSHSRPQFNPDKLPATPPQ